MDRFSHTWHCLFGDQTPDLSWDVVIRQVIEANQLENSTAAVEIVATMGKQNGPPYKHGLMVMARPYRCFNFLADGAPSARVRER